VKKNGNWTTYFCWLDLGRKIVLVRFLLFVIFEKQGNYNHYILML